MQKRNAYVFKDAETAAKFHNTMDHDWGSEHEFELVGNAVLTDATKVWDYVANTYMVGPNLEPIWMSESY